MRLAHPIEEFRWINNTTPAFTTKCSLNHKAPCRCLVGGGAPANRGGQKRGKITAKLTARMGPLCSLCLRGALCQASLPMTGSSHLALLFTKEVRTQFQAQHRLFSMRACISSSSKRC